MNRHWANGFQTNIKNDIYHVEEQLQAYDPHLYLMYSPSTNEHLIMDGLLELAVMRVPQRGFETLDSRVVDHIKRIHTQNGFSASWEIQESENRRQKEMKRQLDDMAQDYAKEMLPAAKELRLTGRTEGVSTYY